MVADSAYDMTYIFNVGGFLPHREHCLLMRGKVADWTKEDVMLFAADNGIRNAEKIIRQVADAVMKFRALAEKNGVRPEWIGRIEECLQRHLREWGFDIPAQELAWTTSDGKYISNVYLEQAYKGNIHLFATIDGAQRRWIFRPSMPEYTLIAEQGISNISEETLRQMVEERM